MKTVDFSETIAASDLKGRRSRHLIEFMKICEYSMSRSFLDLQKNFHRNRRADLHETWYVASGTPAHHSLFKG